jgi:hypothetical protein
MNDYTIAYYFIDWEWKLCYTVGRFQWEDIDDCMKRFRVLKPNSRRIESIIPILY